MKSDPRSASPPLLQVRGLRLAFPAPAGFRGPRQRWVQALDGVDLELWPAEMLGVVGESGAGKSTLARCCVGLLRPQAGGVFLAGRDLLRLSRAELRRARRRIQLVFQDPQASLNPRHDVSTLLAEGLRAHRMLPSSGLREHLAGILCRVGLEAAALDRLPHEFSAGQRQRIAMARALALGPEVLVCDEPVSALDVSVRAQILNLLLDLQEKESMAALFVSHDLSVVERLCNRVTVLFHGRVVETGPARTLFREPHHPYTRALVEALPQLDPGARRAASPRTGAAGLEEAASSGCAYHPRCPLAEERCRKEAPELLPTAPDRAAACHLRPRWAPPAAASEERLA